MLEEYRYVVIRYADGMPLYGSQDYWDCVNFIEQTLEDDGNVGDEQLLFWIMDTNDFDGE